MTEFHQTARRVVVTGVGMVTPLGNNAQETWKGLLAGQSGIGPITRFDTTGFPVTIGGEVKGFDPTQWMDKKDVKKMDTFIHYALAAARMAVEDSRLVINDDNRNMVGVYVGSGIGGLPGIENYHQALIEGGPRKVSPFFIPMVIINLASGQIAIHLGASGPNSCAVSACATGTHCIGDAYHIVRRGDADVMIAGGAESAMSDLSVAGFAAAKTLSTRNSDPEKASRPFDRDRDGFVLSEGAGVVVLEAYEHAKARGAKIYGEILGYGLTGDAYHITSPPENADGAVRCMNMAIRHAGIAKEQITHINAHATSTFADKLETLAIKKVFGDHASRIAISGTKSMTGHLLGGAGGIETIFTLLALRDGIAPPTINLENSDPECDLDYVREGSRPIKITAALKNSFGFGGTNASLVIGKVDLS
ncbi:MAG: beta-ketoacyl-ACP synthase II [Leptospirales bacterium]